MNPWINYHHLYYFKTIAEEGTISKAAQKLRLGQPTLSAQLKQFEDNLGVQLFERQHKKLILTEQGKVALDYATSIFKMGGEMVEAIHDRLKPTKPALCIGALDSIPKQIVLQIVESALQISNCQITLLEGSPDSLLRELTSHHIDLLLTNFVPSGADGKNLLHRLLTRKNVSVFGAPKFKPLRKDFPDSIAGKPLILPTYDSKLRYDLDHWSKTSNIQFETLIESQDISVKKLAAARGLGLLPTASYTVHSQVLTGELIELGKLRGVFEDLYVVSAQRKIENTIAKQLFKTFAV